MEGLGSLFLCVFVLWIVVLLFGFLKGICEGIGTKSTPENTRSNNKSEVKTMPESSVEECENCSRTIGRLETAYVWNEHTVCEDCLKRLAGTNPRPEPKAKIADYDLSSEVPLMMQSGPPPKSISVWGVVSVIMGCGGLMVTWIPIFGCVGYVPAVIGLISGIVGVLWNVGSKRISIQFPVGGILVSALALAMPFLELGAMSAVVNTSKANTRPAITSPATTTFDESQTK